MKYSNEEIKALLISSIPARIKKEQIQKDFTKSLILNSVLAAGAIAGLVLSIVHGQWFLFAILVLALLGIALLFFNTCRTRCVLLGLEDQYYTNVESESYQVETSSIIQKTFNSNIEDEGRYSITLSSGVTKNLFKYFYELCEINDTVYTVQVTDFPIPTGFVLSKKEDSEREYPLN